MSKSDFVSPLTCTDLGHEWIMTHDDDDRRQAVLASLLVVWLLNFVELDKTPRVEHAALQY